MRNIELLVPASSLEVLKIAVVFGADAVYIGGEAFGLRAKAKNFSHEDMAEGIAFAHEHGVKVYVTVNILAHNDDLPGVREYLQELKELKDSGEGITPKAWQREIDQLAAGKQTDTLAMKSMREDLKAVERLRKTAEQLSRQERDKSHDRGPER